MREELLKPDADPGERAEETTLRPRRLSEFVGQPRLKEHLEILLGAARRRRQAAAHLLLAGPPGAGKTTLARTGAVGRAAGLRITSAPAPQRARHPAPLLSNPADSHPASLP